MPSAHWRHISAPTAANSSTTHHQIHVHIEPHPLPQQAHQQNHQQQSAEQVRDAPSPLPTYTTRNYSRMCRSSICIHTRTRNHRSVIPNLFRIRTHSLIRILSVIRRPNLIRSLGVKHMLSTHHTHMAVRNLRRGSGGGPSTATCGVRRKCKVATKTTLKGEASSRVSTAKAVRIA